MAVSGSLHSYLSLVNVQLDLRSTNGDKVGGLLYYTFAEAAVAQGGDYSYPMLEDIELGTGGMDVRLYQRDMGGACGTLVLTATGISGGSVDNGNGTIETYMVHGRGQVTVPCTAASEPAAPQVSYDATQDLSATSDSRRYFPAMAVPDYYAADIDTATDFSRYGNSLWTDQ